MRTLLADIIVTFHLAYVSYVVVGQVLICVGALARWGWVRNPWFRFTHLVAIGIVVVEAAFGWMCPLTIWERELRISAGQSPEELSFVARIVQWVLYYDVPQSQLNKAYIVFGGLVLVTFLLVPPRLRRVRTAS